MLHVPRDRHAVERHNVQRDDAPGGIAHLQGCGGIRRGVGDAQQLRPSGRYLERHRRMRAIDRELGVRVEAVAAARVERDLPLSSDRSRATAEG